MIQSPNRGCIIYKTKMVKVFLGSIPFYIFSLIINLLALEIYPSAALAKPNEVIAQSTSPPKTQQAANPTSTALEPEILSEINRVRTNPQGYAQWLEQQRKYYDGIWLRLPGEKPVRTNRGLKALEEAIAVLKKQPPLPPLDISKQTAAKATTKLDNFATANNIQNISYGRVTPQGIVMSIVVDELFPDRRRRKSLLSANAEDTGVVCKPDPRYAKVCAIAYSDTASDTEVAEANPQTKPQPKNETIASQPKVARAKPETPVTPEVKTTPSPTENTQTPVTSEAETTPSPTENTETPAPPEAPTVTQAPASNQDTVAESLPQPPQPPTPPIVPEVTTPTPEAKNNQDAEVAQAETDKEPQAESQTKVEEQSIEESASNEEDAKKLEAEDPKEVATNSDSDRTLDNIEQGALEDGDRTIPEDGSFYDSYPLEGKKGDSLTIHLESDEFDPFVALIDDKGNIIEQNDDISEKDSNSEIKVSIPEDGAYNIIVNAYDEGGKGKYTLTIN